MSEMVERVARALCRTECEPAGCGYSVWDDSLSVADREKYRELARAAIEAMREPTDIMAMHGGAVMGDGIGEVTNDDCASIFTAMIDASLSDSTQ